jgi:hypothetical protein
MNRTSVKSTNLKSLGYDAERRELEVEFQGGRVYVYSGVPKDVYDRLMEEQDKVIAGDSNASVGHVFVELVKKSAEEYDFTRA